MNCKSGHLIFISIMIVFSACTNGPKEQPVNDSSSNWALLNFEKIDSSNPVLVPGTNEFIDPISKKVLHGKQKMFLIRPLLLRMIVFSCYIVPKIKLDCLEVLQELA